MTIWGKLRAKRDGGPGPRWRVLAWATLAAVVCGAFEMGAPLEYPLQVSRNLIRKHPASGQVVVIRVDERSLAAVGSWPWPRSRHAELIDTLNLLGARSITFDVTFMGQSVPREDAALAAALKRSKSPVTLAMYFRRDKVTGKREVFLPIPELQRHAKLANITLDIDYGGRAWRLPYADTVAGRTYPSLAASLAGVERAEGTFPIDYAIDLRSVPTISTIDILRPKDELSQKRHLTAVSGKDVVIAATALSLNDMISTPGYSTQPAIYPQILGSESLRSGVPRNAGRWPALLLAVVIAAWSLMLNSFKKTLWSLASGGALVAWAPIFFEARSIWLDIAPALLLLIAVSVGISWSTLRNRYRLKGTVNAQSGLLNLDALRRHVGGHDFILIAARIGNYAQIASALSAEEERALIAQIAQRLTIGSSGHALYQGDEGIFAWFSPFADIPTAGEHLDALHGFFRESLGVGDKQVDLSISFGLDAPSERSPASRLGSALVASEEAAAEGAKWKVFDPADLVDASWKLSLLGQLDRAIDSGDFWVAYQPKLDLVSRRIVGAEALARWTHPVKGAIAPVDFILAAEQSDRIERLTRFVLDRAIAAAAAINAAGYPFNVAVNLSTRLIGDPALPRLVGDLLSWHSLDARHLTLEITETAALGTGETNLETLGALRDLGVCISIDDYGTGLSTLEYLKKIPATEIKIDQTFVGAVTRSPSDRLMVHSTIELVHSLGHVVVAEGVEDQATLDALAAMGCDYAQGFFIGRPMTLDAIADDLGAVNSGRAQRG